MVDATCPDCETAMVSVQYRLKAGLSEFLSPYVTTDERREGLLGRLGANEQRPVKTVMCPDCGLLRQYADLKD